VLSGQFVAPQQSRASATTLQADNPFSTSAPWSLRMISVLLALVPLLFATGFLTWTMTMGAREQARSDAWAAKWVKDSGGQGASH
jgi:hypothetical protein